MLNQNEYIYQQWKQNAVKRAFANMCNTYVRIQTIARYIAAGGDPTTNPDIKDDYFYLVGEYGEGIFQDEINKLKLTKEQE